jgi:heptosyltransferase-1
MDSHIDPAQVKRLLIVKMSSIGDLVHALPVAVALRRRYPHAHISWAAEDWTVPLLRGHPAIDRIVVFPTMRWRRFGPRWMQSFRQAAHSLRSTSYDVSIDLQGLLKSAVVALLSGAPMRIGMHEQREGAHLVSRAVPRHCGRLHVVEDYLRCAAFLGASPTPVSFALPVQPEARAAIDHRLSGMEVDAEVPLIVINPSASVAWKTWPVEQWGRVASVLSTAGVIILVGGAAQKAVHAEIARRAGRAVHDLTGRTTLAELVALLERCAIHIAPDTGSAHIAAALGRPVVSLYGPTPPWRKAPYGYQDLVVRGDGQCGIGCPRRCWRGRPCLPSTADVLIAQARRVLARPAPAPAGHVVGSQQGCSMRRPAN